MFRRPLYLAMPLMLAVTVSGGSASAAGKYGAYCVKNGMTGMKRPPAGTQSLWIEWEVNGVRQTAWTRGNSDGTNFNKPTPTTGVVTKAWVVASSTLDNTPGEPYTLPEVPTPLTPEMGTSCR